MRLALRLPALRLARVRVPARWSSRRARARGAVGFGAAAVVAAVVGLGLAVETRRPEWRDPEFGHRLKQVRELDRWRRQAAPDRPLVVLLGSSRAAWAVGPAHLGFDGAGPGAPVVYNFAHTGYGPAGEYLSFDRLRVGGVAPDRVLIEVLPSFLAVPDVPDGSLPAEALSLTEVRVLAPYQEHPGATERAWAAARLCSWRTLRFSLLSHAGLADWLPRPQRKDHLWEALFPLGWMPYDPGPVPPERRAAATAHAKALHAPRLAAFRVAPAQDRVLRDLLARVAAAGAKPALVWLPESPTFRSWFPPGARDHVKGYLAGLSREYAAPVFDTSEWIDDETAFMDGHHLLGPAAVSFSRRFGRECLGPWVGVVPAGEP